MWQSKMSDLGWKVKSQLDLWGLYKTSVSLGLTFLSRIMIFAWKVIVKWTFQEFSNINTLWIKFGLAVKRSRSTQIHNLCKPNRVQIPNATCVFNVSHLCHVTIDICYKFTPFNLRSLYMKFEFEWLTGFCKNNVLIFCWDSNMSDLGWKVKGQPCPLERIYSHSLNRLNISSENNDLGFHSFQNNQLLKMFPFKCIKKQIWPWR